MPHNHALRFRQLQKQQSVKAGVKLGGFLRAWGVATIAGATPFAAISLWQTNEWQSFESLSLIPVSLGIAGVFGLLGMLVIALPATAILRSHDAETTRKYCFIGLAGGIALALVVTSVLFGPPPLYDNWWWLHATMAGCGGFAGLASAFVWDRHRKRQLWPADPAPMRTANPIHDLLH